MRRLNKYITDAGYCSRREADSYIGQGRVTVNGREAALGDMVCDTDIVEVDGERVGRRKKKAVYIACNKPVGVTCTSESSDRTNIIDFIGYKERIFPVGRLDKDSEGLIILTNDGDIVNRILRAGNNNPKEYVVTVNKPITAEFLGQMASGVHILGVKTKPCKISRKNATTFTIHLTQGLNRQIRRMCQALGYKVVGLKRIRVMNISLGDLEPGRWRYLTFEEERQMHELLAGLSGTEEASDEKKAMRGRGPGPGKRSYADYRRRAKAEKRPLTQSEHNAGHREPSARSTNPGGRSVTTGQDKTDSRSVQGSPHADTASGSRARSKAGPVPGGRKNDLKRGGPSVGKTKAAGRRVEKPKSNLQQGQGHRVKPAAARKTNAGGPSRTARRIR